MKIVIFGGKGFIGKVLEKQAQQNYEVVTLDLPKVDVRKPETYAKLLKKEQPDVVINLSAILGTMLESPSILKLYEINTLGNLKVLYAARDAGVKNFIFTSSITVHGENRIGKHQKTTSPFNPKHPYSASKAAAEYAMMRFAKEAPEMKLITVRPTMVLGENTYMPHAPIEFIRTIMQDKSIEIYGKGDHVREWIWVDDVAEGILKALEFALTNKPGYHPFFLSGNRISMRGLAKKIIGKLRGEIVFKPSTSQAFTLTSDEESHALLNWFPRNDIDMIIEKLIEILAKEKKAN